MRNGAILAVALFLILVQANLYRFLGPLGLHGWTPSAALALVVFLGVHESSMARGAILAFVIGHALDLFASAPIGLFTFIYVALWWLARLAGVRLAAQTVPTQMALAFGFSLAESLFVLVLLVVFGADAQRPVELASVVVPHATSTALVAPFIFRLAERLQQTAAPPPRATEVAR
jgi:rod shape-determining protein MreD